MSKINIDVEDDIKNRSDDELFLKCRNLGIRLYGRDREQLISSILCLTDNVYFTQILYSIETFSRRYIREMEYLLDEKYIRKSVVAKINLRIDETQQIINKLQRKLNKARERLEYDQNELNLISKLTNL